MLDYCSAYYSLKRKNKLLEKENEDLKQFAAAALGLSIVCVASLFLVLWLL